MNSKDLRELAPLFSHFDAYRMALTAAYERGELCDCSGPSRGATDRRWRLAGRCEAATKPADSCLTVVHLGIRAHLATIGMPVDHVDDAELDHAIDVGLHGLVLRAPQLTQQQFVDQLKAALHSDRVVAAEAGAAQDGDRADG